jgi:hypothetical protein
LYGRCFYTYIFPGIGTEFVERSYIPTSALTLFLFSSSEATIARTPPRITANDNGLNRIFNIDLKIERTPPIMPKMTMSAKMNLIILNGARIAHLMRLKIKPIDTTSYV